MQKLVLSPKENKLPFIIFALCLRIPFFQFEWSLINKHLSHTVEEKDNEFCILWWNPVVLLLELTIGSIRKHFILLATIPFCRNGCIWNFLLFSFCNYPLYIYTSIKLWTQTKPKTMSTKLLPMCWFWWQPHLW